MGASLTMIDRHYGHLARDGREHAVALLDSLAADETAWTSGGRRTRWGVTRVHARSLATAVSAANRPDSGEGGASRGVARVVSDVSVLCLQPVDGCDNGRRPGERRAESDV